MSCSEVNIDKNVVVSFSRGGGGRETNWKKNGVLELEDILMKIYWNLGHLFVPSILVMAGSYDPYWKTLLTWLLMLGCNLLQHFNYAIAKYGTFKLVAYICCMCHPLNVAKCCRFRFAADKKLSNWTILKFTTDWKDGIGAEAAFTLPILPSRGQIWLIASKSWLEWP